MSRLWTMTNLPKSLHCVPKIMCRLTAQRRSCGSCPSLTEAEKYLLRFRWCERRMRGHAPGKDSTVCASSQAGCVSQPLCDRMSVSRARFRQARYTSSGHACVMTGHRVTSAVLMGQGEPCELHDPRALRRLNSPDGRHRLPYKA